MTDQLDLPDTIQWPDLTREWWKALGSLEGADEFTAMQWHYLLDTALLHAAVWGNGDFTKHGELGKRMDAFGVTPASMARLGRGKSSVSAPRAAPAAPPVQQSPAADAAERDTPAVVSPIEAARQRAAKARGA